MIVGQHRKYLQRSVEILSTDYGRHLVTRIAKLVCEESRPK